MGENVYLPPRRSVNSGFRPPWTGLAPDAHAGAVLPDRALKNTGSPPWRIFGEVPYWPFDKQAGEAVTLRPRRPFTRRQPDTVFTMSLFKRWFPWKFLVRRAARSYGFIDPLGLLARIRRFSQPSEVGEPLELIRAGIAFHARGLVNTRAIQHNLDWVWPYWVERQFNPEDPSFIPRAFSITHVNLTHRNWTALGRPDLASYPIVDPRGLVTPLFDGWSLDLWLLPDEGPPLIPSKSPEAEQMLTWDPDLRITTRCRDRECALGSEAFLIGTRKDPVLELEAAGSCAGGGRLVVALRPYNPEGIQFVERIEAQPEGTGWVVDGKTSVDFSEPPDAVLFSNYREGDVLQKALASEPPEGGENATARCDVGMATAAALFTLEPGSSRTVRVRIPLDGKAGPDRTGAEKDDRPSEAWASWMSGAPRLEIPDDHIRFLHDAALRTLIMLSADDVVPGPYTYKRFWFRDACFMLEGLLCAGFTERCRRILDTFPDRQKLTGYFQSQHGEWDSNGQVLWIYDRFERLSDTPPEPGWMAAVSKGAEWIRRKRIRSGSSAPHEGLFPPGFSAEHLGPNDYYYWDAFWGVAGLRGAARLASRHGSREKSEAWSREAADLERAVFRSIEMNPAFRRAGAIPAAPYRRMDAGAVGSLVADYPLRLVMPGDPRFLATVDHLMENCFYRGAFFQDMIHSGINPYLTLAMAQTLLRAGDPRYRDLFLRVADLASPTGQWPEAIHPWTEGGCMGDGQHGWAAVEFVQLIRNLFVREEDDRLVLGSGILPDWLQAGEPLFYGPTLTAFGRVSLRVEKDSDGTLRLHLEPDWHTAPPAVEARVPGYRPRTDIDPAEPVTLEPEEKTT